jgi:hypothetical protein
MEYHEFPQETCSNKLTSLILRSDPKQNFRNEISETIAKTSSNETTVQASPGQDSMNKNKNNAKIVSHSDSDTSPGFVNT